MTPLLVADGCQRAVIFLQVNVDASLLFLRPSVLGKDKENGTLFDFDSVVLMHFSSFRYPGFGFIRIHVSGTCEPLRDRLVPFHNNTVDSVLQQESKNLSGDLVSDIGGGRTRNDANPYDDGTETPFRLLSQRCMGEEAGRVDGQPVDLPTLDQVTNLGTDSVPDTIKRSVEDSAERLDGDVGVSADGLGEEGCSEQVRTVDEVRVVALVMPL